jgi:hypothetical protein
VITFEWKDLAWIAGVVTLLGGMLLAFLRFKLAGDFAKSGDISAINGRITALEQRMQALPSHDDLRALQQRVGGLEVSVSVVGEKVNGLGQIMIRVEHQLTLVSQHLIQEGR